jgi:acetyl-CoA carboxylase biotin carboxyl carrier protein
VAELSFAEVGEILHLLQRVEGAEVTLEWGDLRMYVRRGVAPQGQSTPGAVETPVGAAAAPVTEPPTEAPIQKPAPAAERVPAESAGDDAADVDVPAHWVAVKAPMVGTFYRAPKPGDPPFADVGDVVAAGDTVGLIEVMKLFTELTSEVSGKVARVGAEDATLVEYGQPIVWIEPS